VTCPPPYIFTTMNTKMFLHVIMSSFGNTSFYKHFLRMTSHNLDGRDTMKISMARVGFLCRMLARGEVEAVPTRHNCHSIRFLSTPHMRHQYLLLVYYYILVD
jgi:hypothetical protein